MSTTDAGELDATSTGLSACDKPLYSAYDVALLDLDGVVNRGDQAVPHAIEALSDVRAQGMRLRFVTNNASRTPEQLAERLSGFGIEVAPNEVVTSAQAAARVLHEHLPEGSTVLVVGDEGLWEAVKGVGLEPVRVARPVPDAVVQGYSRSTGWEILAEATVAVREGALWVASNSDLTLPSERGPLPGNGAFVDLIARITGSQPLVAGKPEPALHRESVDQSGARNPLVVGDRLDTDIEGARRAGSDSMLVLTGVSGAADVLRAGPSQRPNYVASDLRGLLEPHALPERVDPDGWRLAEWLVRASADELVLSSVGGDGAEGASETDALQALRALCSAAWATGVSAVRADGPAATVACTRLGLG